MIFLDEKKEIVVGSYIIVKNNKYINEDLQMFIDNNIGKVDNIKMKIPEYKKYVYLKYENVPTDIKNYFHGDNRDIRKVYLADIGYCSDYKEKLEMILNAEKFNI